jgi:aldose 1-epimerase
MSKVVKRRRAALLTATLACSVCALFLSFGESIAPANAAPGSTRAAKPEDAVIPTFTLKNSKGAHATIIAYGATLTELWVPDRNNKMGDVVLGFDDSKRYEGDHPHFGGIIGRYANRIAKGKFVLDGKEYQLAINNGPNTLHGGKIGFDHRMWTGEIVPGSDGKSVRLTYNSPDGEETFPGNLTVTVVYTLTEQNALKLEYTAKTDKATPINLTNHSYFNLSGTGSGDVLAYVLKMNASHYTPVDSTLIPTGEIASVKNTPYDFTNPMKIGARISELGEIGGYDMNYVIDGENGKLRQTAAVNDPASGRVMEVWTTEPGVQLYIGIGLDGSIVGKGGAAYKKYGAVCLETQHFPDSVNHPNFPSVILRPGQTYHQETIYKFSVE